MRKPKTPIENWLWRQMEITSSIISENKKILKLNKKKIMIPVITDSINALEYDHKMQKLLYLMITT